MIVVPTIFEKDFGEVQIRIEKIRELSRWVQIDVIDGLFSQGKTFELELMNKLSRTDGFLWDVHLMVKEPERWIEKCMFVGASRIIGQVEMMKDRNLFINKLKEEGVEAGLGFDIDTKVDNIPEETDMVLLMARKAGFEDNPVDNAIFEKIKSIRQTRGERLIIAVDGGITADNFSSFEKAGVNIVYCGSHYFEIINAK